MPPLSAATKPSMFRSLPSWIHALLPAPSAVGGAERLRSCLGALLGIAVTGLASTMVLGPGQTSLLLIAPMGASAVLLFALPASPLAQPWSIIGGNLVSAVIGITCARLIADPAWAGPLAVGLAIAAMFALRCLHPPSGAIALSAVVGGPAVHAAGYAYAWVPVGLNTVLLVATAIVYNRLAGRRYPHAQRLATAHPHGTRDAPPTVRLGFDAEDLHAVLKEYGQVLDISVDDLDAIVRRTEMHAFGRRLRQTRCGDIMSRDVVAVTAATALSDAWQLMQRHAVHALPVVDEARRVVGIVTRTDFLAHAAPQDFASAGARLRAMLRPPKRGIAGRVLTVGTIMSTPARRAPESTPIVELVPWMADQGLHHVPIVDTEEKLIGMVTQSDLVAALYETGLASGGHAAFRQRAASRGAGLKTA
jgi:CBS domain-containing membrane protein